jgi:hypothetical protein
MFQILSGFPDHVLAVEATGKITAKDYDTVMVPAVEAKMAIHRPLDVLFRLGPEFQGFEAGAMVEDARLGLSHLKDWGRIAVVTDAAGVRDMVNFFRLFLKRPVKVFFNADYEAAKAWIADERAGAA